MNIPKSWYLAIQGYQNPTRWHSRSGRTHPPRPTPTPTPAPSTKYVKKLTINDMSKKNMQDTTFSFSDIAKDVAKIEKITLSNKVVEKYLRNPLTTDLQSVNLVNRILLNIALNVVNDPKNPPPTGYVKRAMLVHNDGSVIGDVTTFRYDKEAVASKLNLDSNIVNMNLYKNILNTPDTPKPDPIYVDNMLYPPYPPVFLSPFGIYFNTNNLDPTLLSSTAESMLINNTSMIFFSKSNYKYPANEINPHPTGGVATAFSTIENHGTREEIQQARIQDWGYASRRSATLNLLPNYYVAHNIEFSDGWSVTLRVSYVKYQ